MEKIKKNRFSKVLVLLLAVMMIFTMMPSMAFADTGNDTEAEPSQNVIHVTYNAQKDGTFLTIPQVVSAVPGLAASYGYTVSTQESVTALDVVVADHIRTYGDAFTADTAKNYLEVGDTGLIRKAYGTAGTGVSFLVNGKAPADEKGTGYMINQAVIAENDDVEFFFLQDTEGWGDYYTEFDIKSLSIPAGSDFSLTLKGVMAMAGMFGMQNQLEPIDGTSENAALTLHTVNADGSLSAALKNSEGTEYTFDQNGKVTLKLDQEGEYLITASGFAPDDIYETCPIVLPYCKVVVTPSSYHVTVTLSDKGQIARDKEGNLIADIPLTVGDLDQDGLISFSDALTALHKERNEAGVSAYEVGSTGYVTKLWDHDTYNTLFFQNNSAIMKLVKQTAIGEGDKLVASVNSDDQYYADWYTYFDSDSKKVVIKENVTLELKGFQGMAGSAAGAAGGLKIGTISDGQFVQLGNSVTDQDGKVTISFDKAGTYYVTAQGTVKDTVYDYSVSPAQTLEADCPIIAPVCKITVVDRAVEKIEITDANGNVCPQEGYVYNVGDTAAVLKTAPIENVPGAAYTYKWKYKTTPDAETSSNAGTSSVIKKETFTPKTDIDSVKYYYCEVTVKYNTKSDVYETALVPVKVIAKQAQQPKILNELSSAVYMQGTNNVDALNAKATVSDNGTLRYTWYVKDGDADFIPIENANGEKYLPSTDTVGVRSYYCEITNTLKSVSGKTYKNSITTEIAVIEVKPAAEFGADWEGDGTAQNPFLLKNADDLTKLSALVDSGITFDGKYFELTENVTLPEDWKQIGSGSGTGNGANMKPFSGIFDGAGHTVTVPEGGKALFLYVREATIKNLKIYGTKIEGYGLVDGYTVDYGADGKNVTDTNPKYTVTIENCVLKSGTQTLKSGFIGGYASGINTITIRDSIIESGVIIGYNKDQKNIGGFAGEFNGYIVNCQNSGTVYGIDFVGGICADKGQSMGPCSLYDCTFDGTIEASGKYVGGILGAGYGGTGWGFAKNSPWPTVVNCKASGTIAGGNYVGGILGAEPGTLQCWNNGVGYIQNNLFTGKVSASAEDAYVGGIIGYINALNRFTVISNNFYEEGCGTDAGVGEIKYIENAENDGVSVGSGWNSQKFDYKKYGRDDDLKGADAEKLAKACTASEIADGTIVKKLNAGLNSSGNWTQNGNVPAFSSTRHLLSITSTEISTSSGLTQTVGAADVLKGKALTLTYSDGTQETIDASKAEKLYTLTNEMAGKYIPAVIVYNNHQLVFNLLVKAGSDTPSQPTDNSINVKISVLGDDVHDASTGTQHTLKKGGLKTWISETSLNLKEGSTVMDALAKVLNQNGFSWMNADKPNSTAGNYIQSITNAQGVLLAEFTNGKNSGWMYTLNGTHPLLGVSEQILSDKDIIVFHYTDNYHIEEGSENWGMPEEINSVTTTGSSGSAVTASPTEVKVVDKTAADGTKVKVAEVTVSADNQKEILKQAKGNKSAEIVLNVTKDAVGTATSADIKLDKSFLESILKDTNAKLTVQTPFGTKTYTQDELKALIVAASGTTVTVEVKADDSEDANLAQVKEQLAKVSLIARSAKTEKKNVKVTLKVDAESMAAIDEIQSLGYTVKYKFYRSTKKAAGYSAKLTKTSKTYLNTSGVKGSKYYYKARVLVYDGSGKLVAFSKLTQCKYAARIWTK